jgi:hypothetical protein
MPVVRRLEGSSTKQRKFWPSWNFEIRGYARPEETKTKEGMEGYNSVEETATRKKVDRNLPMRMRRTSTAAKSHFCCISHIICIVHKQKEHLPLVVRSDAFVHRLPLHESAIYCADRWFS